MIKTLQKRFVLSAMLAITILLVTLTGAINIGNLYISQRQSEQMIEALLDEKNMLQSPKMGRPKGFSDFFMDENFKMSAVYFTVRVDSLYHIVKVDTARIADVSEREAIALCQAVISEGSSEGRIQGFRYRVAESERDKSKLYLFLDSSVQTRNILTVLFFSATAAVICWIVMLLLVFLISKRAIRPIAENLERQKQFVTDAGHELKTPLAIILANTEAMELYQGESKWSRNIREQTVRLNGLMQNLLTLAKAEESRNTLPTETVSLSSLVEEVLQMFSEPMKLKEIRFNKRIDTDIDLKANKEQLRRLFSLLLDNAVKYSVPGGEIDISLERHGKSLVFQMENTCAELPDCPPEKLFDRFYRADAARTQKNGGYGIGLSAAKKIAELYGGTIKAAYSQPDKIAFTVVFS
ncbi:MAG: HAMP domain-containing histidine kinase [Roseburia sp.]|nr:HAMP domain-containing histidine kinase [Roseburia sp.]MCM1098874.1 HAMP domain-containing histidine kinase [Ruminococcus flavefaciens]